LLAIILLAFSAVSNIPLSCSPNHSAKAGPMEVVINKAAQKHTAVATAEPCF
jgi:hypothetical protein